MANYTAADIKALRERTGAGMLDVKKALDEANGDSDKALEILRIKGLKGVSKREDRATSEGLVAVDITATDAGETGTLVELNCETDFVAKNEKFIGLADTVLAAVVAAGATDVESALAAPTADGTVTDTVTNLSAEIGEKVVLRRVAVVSGPKVTSYVHRTAKDLPPTIGVLVVTDAAGAAVGKDVAQHVAALAPTYLSREDVPAEAVDNERRIVEEISRNEGKPEAALPKIVEGRVNAFFKQVALLDQDYAKDNKLSVAKVAGDAGITITDFARFKVGA